MVSSKPIVLLSRVEAHAVAQAMEDVGYALGPAFQKHLEAESLSGIRSSRSLVSLVEPQSAYAQSRYQMHPTTVDAILQACAPALWNGNRTNINAVIIPAIIDEMMICTQPDTATTGMEVVRSGYSGVGDPNATKNYTADADVYDSETGVLLFQLSKLRTSILNTRAVSYTEPTYCSMNWRPDITFMSQETLNSWLADCVESASNAHIVIKEVIKLIAFKTPTLKVFEGIMMAESSSSLWMDTVAENKETGLACEPLHVAHTDAKALLAAKGNYSSSSATAWTVYDISGLTLDNTLMETKFDFIIARVVSHHRQTVCDH